MRVQAEWFDTHLACLSGIQFKLGATLVAVEGVVVSVRGDHPTHPTEIGLEIRKDDGKTAMVKLKHVKAALTDKGWATR